jgi:hypothetical protein
MVIAVVRVAASSVVELKVRAQPVPRNATHASAAHAATRILLCNVPVLITALLSMHQLNVCCS